MADNKLITLDNLSKFLNNCDDRYIKIPSGLDLASLGWGTISTLAALGVAQSCFAVGDTKDIDINGSTWEVAIMGFNHDAANSITFGMTGTYNSSSTYYMNSSNTNAGGWPDCYMRNTTMPLFYSYLSSDLQSVIRTITKKSTAGSASTSIVECQDQLFLFAYIEIYNTTSSGYKDEGSIYDYWSTRTSSSDRTKYDDGGSACAWWLRSPNTSGSTTFYYVGTHGAMSNGYAGYTCRVSFGFVV